MRKYTPEQQTIAFWNNVAITADDNQCWLWTGFCHPKGYGYFKLNRRNYRVHRIAWSYPDYVIPNGMMVLHSCDVRNCCNPKHLFIGTHQDNMDDMKAKKREIHVKGEQQWLARLTSEQVCKIRQRYALGGISMSQLARDYNLGKSTVWNLLARITWKHLP